MSDPLLGDLLQTCRLASSEAGDSERMWAGKKARSSPAQRAMWNEDRAILSKHNTKESRIAQIKMDEMAERISPPPPLKMAVKVAPTAEHRSAFQKRLTKK